MARPREFDIDQALEAATEIFWRQGYAGTSLADLMDAMGIQKGSVYKAFGSKHELFLRVLRRYLDQLFSETRAAVAAAESPKEGIQRFVELVQGMGYAEDFRKGCLAVNAIVEMAPHDEEVQRVLQGHHRRTSEALTAIIAAGQQDGSFRLDVPAADLALYLTVVAAGFVSTSKASLTGLENPGIGDIVLSTLRK